MQHWLTENLNPNGIASVSPHAPSSLSTAGEARFCFDCMEDFRRLVSTLFAAVPHPLLLLDAEGKVRLCNPAASALLPDTQQLADNESFESFLLKACLPGFLAEWPFEQAREEGIEINGTPFIVTVRPVRLKNKIAGRLLELKEVYSLGNAHEELKSVRQQLHELSSCIEISSDGFCIMDSKARVIFVNHVYERITGLKREAIIGHSMSELIAQGVFDRSTSEKILETGRPVTLTLKVRTGKSVLVSGSPLFDKNNEISRIVCSIRDITELNRLQNELESVATLKTRYEEELVDLKMHAPHNKHIIFRSENIRRIVELALRLGSVDSTILLQSESGAGKELFADFIQRNSLRFDKPFLKINCGAIPEHLLESELFGYTRGAFTGANREGKVGLFEAANHGTLLLDEVGELPKPLQVKLLRVLQEKVVRRIGDTTSREVDVRILASTNRDLAAMVEAGEFREDLFYRLNVVPIYIPPLRKRKEDIFPLLQAFLEKFSKRYSTEKVLHPKVLPVLLEYSWPGNVRELENIMERLVVTSAGKIINVTDLPDEFFQQEKDKLESLPLKGKSLKEIMDAYEATILRHYYSEYGTTRDVAAALGIHQSNVVRKLQRLSLEDVSTTKSRSAEKARKGRTAKQSKAAK
ncbi:MAG: sigma 54-interacting transcriptional regulator [Desulfovibrionaceae bacterium]|nr:sigma 54-interacting transcriptional regulator [Desulfovibrionaceae bacterium]